MVDIDEENKKRNGNRNFNRDKTSPGNIQIEDSKRSASREKICVPLFSLIHTLGLRVVWVRWDRTKHGWHVVIKVREKLTLAETIAAQAILGSDPARERLNLARCISLRKKPSKYWEARANILYSRKAER